MINIFKYFKNKKQKELEFCDLFCKNFQIIKNKVGHHDIYGWLLSIRLSEHNFKILERHRFIIKYSYIFDEYLEFRFVDTSDKNHPSYPIFPSNLNDDEIISNPESTPIMHKLFTENELLIKSIIE